MTNGDMTPSSPEGQESLEQLLADVLKLVDETVAQISDDEVEKQLQRVLDQSGHSGRSTSEPPSPEDSHQDLA